MSNGEKQNDRDRVGMKGMEAEMKEQRGRMNIENSADWFDRPPPFPLYLLYSAIVLGQRKKISSLSAGQPYNWLANCRGITVSND